MIETPRLILTQYTSRHLLALIETPETFEAQFGHRAAPGLREFFVSGDVSEEWLASLRGLTDTGPWSFGYGMVHRERGDVIGTAGFKAPPDAEGTVEIAYGVVPSCERHGYATEAARALTDFALSHGASHVIAHTLPENNASTVVLTRCGFLCTGEVIDPEDGPVWRWELPD